AVVFFNALSGSIAYARKKRIDYRSGSMFALASVPGAIIGALSVNLIPRTTFNIVFGCMLIAVSLFLFMRPGNKAPEQSGNCGHLYSRRLVEKNGQVHTYSYSLRNGLVISALVGVLSSLLGIGGGIIHVPAMVKLLNFPAHIATATSHFTLAVTVLAGVTVHLLSGTLSGNAQMILYLSFGVIAGAPVGALLSDRMKGLWIMRLLALALGSVGVRILIQAMQSSSVI
ncbi:MAG: sulfite exporter TauE/SafE family protein, partial [Candidatus Wallbacteria bacterium]|nr:sulfite exporter TauE/SafE family protein [Candidatus Wallbacteria bacterium]